MAYNEKFKFSLQNKDGDYYIATQNADNSWTVSTDPTLTYLKNSPLGWQDIAITWERNMTYWGVFRSLTNKFKFVLDARAIVSYLLFGNGGVNAYCKFTIYILNEETFAYEVFYASEIDLSAAKEDKLNKAFDVATLDSRIYEALKANADNEYNIPFWKYNEIDEVWSPMSYTQFVYHNGIKSLWRLNLQGANNYTYQLYGFCGGRHGAPPNDGYHTLPALANYTITQANGTTTFAGNDLLEPVIQYGNQSPRINEVNFLNGGNLNAIGLPIKPVIPNVDLNFSFEAKFETDIFFFASAAPGADFLLRVVVFEINEDGEPTQTTPGQYDIFSTLYTITTPPVPSYTPPPIISNSVTLSLTPYKTYVISIIFDDTVGSMNASSGYCLFDFEYFRASISSNYNSGTAAPVSAPVFPASTYPAIRPFDLLNQIASVLDSTETDAYGFPIPTETYYVGVSDFFSNPDIDPADNFDLVPYQCLETSENAIRNVVGFPFISKSLNSFFRQWRNINMMGLSVDGDNTIRMEPLDYYLNASLEVLSLENSVSNLTIVPYTEIMGNRLANGWNDPQTNKNFGTDTFCYPADWNIQITKVPKTLDMRTTQTSADMYYIEKARVQNNSTNSSPSSSNGCLLVQIVAESTRDAQITNPGGETVVVDVYELETYPTAQSTNPTTAPYIQNMYYPDTAFNLGLDPASCLYRNGAYLRSLCDSMPMGSIISFRKVYQQQYNNPTTPALIRPGMSKKLNTSFVINQVDDIQLSNLASPLFRPYVFQFESNYPVNMYGLINTYPTGYISFYWQGVQYKGFLLAATQQIGNNASTSFKLLAHPDTTDAQLQLN